MDGHDGLYAAIKLVLLKSILEINRQQTRLPVVAVDDVRSETKHRQTRQSRLIKKGKLLDILIYLSIRKHTAEVELIVKKIENNAIHLELEYAHILLSPGKIHIKMVDILHLLLVLLTDGSILRNDHTYIILFLVKVPRQRTYYVSKSAGLDKWHTL